MSRDATGRCTLRPGEEEQRTAAVRFVTRSATELWGDAASVVAFGSWASGLSLPDGDVPEDRAAWPRRLEVAQAVLVGTVKETP